MNLTIKNKKSRWDQLTILIICRSYFVDQYCCLQFISNHNNIQYNNQRKLKAFLKIQTPQSNNGYLKCLQNLGSDRF